ncbi:hypothetical protein [Mycobacterium hubeiense]|uniref:hypothetical protein n=1 Tax=Mycobacterium hubeiense TaxID=1867256 RepID=UPI000C7F5398|nr:hypothetical protein [Mycobacterium sp. QGD 101]
MTSTRLAQLITGLLVAPVVACSGGQPLPAYSPPPAPPEIASIGSGAEDDPAVGAPGPQPQEPAPFVDVPQPVAPPPLVEAPPVPNFEAPPSALETPTTTTTEPEPTPEGEPPQ